MPELVRELVERRVKNFWGYGRLEAPTWFVGIEEGLGKSETDLSMRFRATDREVPIDESNRKGWIDVYSDMTEIVDHAKWYTHDARSIQPTLRHPIALYLFLKFGDSPTRSEILDCQKRTIGRNVPDPEVALLELLPLPVRSISVSSWSYGAAGIDGLESRAAYERKYLDARATSLARFIREHQPRLVIFYSLRYWPYVERRLGIPFESIAIPPNGRGLFGRLGPTSICVIPQGQRSGHISHEKLDAYARQVYAIVHGKEAARRTSPDMPRGVQARDMARISTNSDGLVTFRSSDYTSPACHTTRDLCRVVKREFGVLDLPREQELAWDRDVWRPALKQWKNGGRAG